MIENFKDSALRKALSFAKSVCTEEGLNSKNHFRIEDWDNMIAVIIETTINRLSIVFYEDGEFRNFSLEKKDE